MPEDLQQSIDSSDLITAAIQVIPNPKLQAEETLNDSDKTITVPANKIWEILWIHIELTSTASVGNRSLKVVFRDDSNDTICEFLPGVLQAESLQRFYLFSPQFSRETSFFSTFHLHHPIPKIFLPSSYSIRIYDTNGVDPTADDMIIQMMVNEWSV